MSAAPPSGHPPLEVRFELPLDPFELSVEFTTASRVTGVFGPSGAGKTSLLRVIAGIEPAARGAIRFGGEVWLDTETGCAVPPERRRIGYVPQEGLLFPHLDVRQNLLSGSRRAGGDTAESLASVCELLELEPLLERSVDTLSGGEARRVALGRAICSRPRLLLLDEPLAALDLRLRRHRVLPFLRRVRDELEIPMLFVSHDPIEVQALCDELVVLAAGRVVTRGPVREALTDPRVFPIAEQQGFENVLPAVLAASSGGASRVRLAGTEVEIEVPRVEAAPASEVLVGIPARGIIVATRPPAGLSARSVLPARVSRVRVDDDTAVVFASIAAGLPDLAAEISARAVADLGLGSGQRVYLLIESAGALSG